MLVAPPKPSSSSLFQDALRSERHEMVTPTSTGQQAGSGRTFVSHRNSACSLDEAVETDDLTGVLLNNDPSTPSHAIPGNSNSARNGAATPKRKSPHLFKQLANEFRWMHNNLKNGYSSGSGATPKHYQSETPRGYGGGSFARTPQTTREILEGQDEEDEGAELLTMSVRSSLRRHTSAPASASEGGRKTSWSAPPGKSSKWSQKTRWRMMENGEVEPLQTPELPITTPDPFSPEDCHYVVRHPKASDAVATGELSQSESCIPSLREDVTLPDALLSGSMLSDSDNEDGTHDSPLPRRFSCGDEENESSDGESATARRSACSCDRRAAKERRASQGILDDDSDDSEDRYEIFLSSIAQLQRQTHLMNQHTAELRHLFTRERKARLRSKGKGQHLSWTRTVEAANTIQFWRMKVHLLRTFESLYVNTVQEVQQHLPLFAPQPAEMGRTSKAFLASGTLFVISRSRRGFLESSRVLTAQQSHLQALGEQLKSCWQANAALREELRQFEQREVRNPHDTFSVAGMDAEHFIASLPPRISALTLYSGSTKSSAQSLDSMDDIHAPRLLLTVQNLSPSEEEDDVCDRRPSGSGLESVGISPNSYHPPGGSSEPRLVSCMKECATTSLEGSGSTPPSSPKRFKYVIQSVIFDSADGVDANNSNNNNSINARSSMRGSLGSRIATPLTGALSTSLEAQMRRKRERHVTFALEPEVLDARPRFSAHGRTIELLEQICMDKQAPWNGLTLLQSALEQRSGELTAMQERMEDEQREVLARAVTMTPICATAPTFRCEGEHRSTLSRPETAPSPTLTNISNSAPTFGKPKPHGKRSKVKPKECAQCSVM